MNYTYEKLKKEILQDHAKNDYMKAELMPLTDKVNISTELMIEYKNAAIELTNDYTFAYEIIMWQQGNVLKGAYKPLQN